MARIPVNPSWSNVDISSLVDNWMIDADGTTRRLSGRVRPVHALGQAVSHVVGQSPRTLVTKARAANALAAYANTANPHLAYQVTDDDHQARDRVYRILAVPPAINVTDSNTFAATYAGQSNEQSYAYNLNVATNNHWEVYYSEIPVPRGDEANAVINFGVSTYGAMRILDVTIQDVELFDLDEDYERVTMDTARSMDVITPQLVEDTRKALHNHRTKGLPIDSSWSADTDAGTWKATDSPGDEFGMTVDSGVDGVDTYVNLLDHAETSRTANTPGVSSHVYRAGWGREDVANGQLVKYRWNFHAAVNEAGVANAMVKVEGPIDASHVVVNAVITAPAWYTLPAHVHLNASIGDDERGAGRNKFDVFGQANNGKLHILGWTAERVAP
jgi:hypothetical protein